MHLIYLTSFTGLLCHKPVAKYVYFPFCPNVSDPELATHCNFCSAVGQGPSSVKVTQSRLLVVVSKKATQDHTFQVLHFNFIKKQANIPNVSNALIHISLSVGIDHNTDPTQQKQLTQGN